MTWSQFMALSAVGLCAACNGPTANRPDGQAPPDLSSPAAPLQPGLKVVADDPSLLAGPTGSSFDLLAIRSLLVRFQLASLPADPSWVTLELLTPGGPSYQTWHIPFSANPTVTQLPSTLGMQYLVAVSRPTVLTGGVGLDMAILVGGTNLQRHPLPGMWPIRATVDGAPALSAQQVVELRTP